MLKKILLSGMIISCIINVVPSFAIETSRNIEETFNDGSYFETELEVIESKTTNTKSGKKTASFKDSSGKTMWSITVEGTFKYTGTSATCTKSFGNSISYVSYWKLEKATATKSGNTASAKTTGRRYSAFICVETIPKTVTLSCDKNGKLV